MLNTKLDFSDLLIVPKQVSDITSRSLVNPYNEKTNFLPIITAPMDTVISFDKLDVFLNNRIHVCLPRYSPVISHSFNRIVFNSFSIIQMKNLLVSNQLKDGAYLIDVANGHMNSVIELTKKIKEFNPSIRLMVGNIANPETYRLLSNAGADYVRVGIGNGGGCLTTQNTGVGYPMASLIKECYDISTKLDRPAFIVADGGMKDYSDIIKALALGADYVMLGNILNKALESAGPNYLWKWLPVSQKLANKAYRFGISVYKKFRGMSTKEVQKKWGVEKVKTSEGVVRFRKVEYTLSQWTENFEHYLRSAMSYAGAHDLNEFINNTKLVIITDSAYKRFNK